VGDTTGTRGKVALLTCMAMLAFAGNSLLVRMAMATTSIDAASFTAIRIGSGALTLLAILLFQRQRPGRLRDGWLPALMLFAYAATYSFAYRDMDTGAGALVLFAAVQLLMISYGLVRGERTSWIGLLMACGGLVAFLLPGASAPPLGAAALMALAGFAWGAFSLSGRPGQDPLAGTALSFLLAIPLALALVLLNYRSLQLDQAGVAWALVSGVLTSGIGYVIWYWVRVRLASISASAVQLSVPVISAVLGVLVLGERVGARAAVSALFVLGGIGVVLMTARPTKGTANKGDGGS
jgi:drug/metabolite transporter (DMT)-like permease